VLDQRPGRQIPEDLGSGRDTLRLKPYPRNTLRHFEVNPFQDAESGGDRSGLPPLSRLRRL